ncbi:hypothetical protein F5B22DRAFT_635875 [Xylaria bambusicola]|uniref:uncharacterized protein n=1 Tax=Xylaria bambusicola TaxID=326684 RepID=UPI002008B4FB|nr:uncharacterized protein F5B22DRAFT_635875 [Xylaria bambusicola]KAI0517234.1 hypothetical protein F5B22DRAFT_635875 [Xylaria bambusicola]
MSHDEASPLLSSAKKGKNTDLGPQESAESTPLLSSSSATVGYDGDSAEREDDNASIRSRQSHPSSTHSTKKKLRRWPSFVAMGILGCFVIAIIVLAFIVPDAVQEYAQQAAVIEPTSLSIDSITTDGVRARIQANFQLDGSRVKNDNVRRIGKASTWVANQLGSDAAKIDVYVPDYDNILLGSATIPPLVVSLRDGIMTQFDFIADIHPGNVEGLRTIANDWLDGKLDNLRLNGKTDLSLKSGFIPLGTHTVSETLIFEANKIPVIPKYNITRFNVEDGPIEGSILVDMSLSTFNEYPIELDIPELAFEIMVPGCADTDPFIIVAEASTGKLHIEPVSEVFASVYGVIHELPDSLTRVCPDSSSSPLDMFLKQYMHGEPATLFVRGSSRPDGDTPKWIADILASVTVPVPFPGRTLDGMIRDFSLTDVHFTLPDPFADPDDPDASPKVSGNILVTASIPSDMNLAINVTNVRATADVIYKSKKMGELNLRKWQHANSTRVDGKGKDGPSLKIESRIIEAPLNITDADVFSDVVQALLFGNKPISLDIQALVDVKVDTSLGELILKEVPAEGKVPVKPLPKGAIDDVNPKISSLKVVDSSADSLTLQALVNVTNPSVYTAYIPFINVHLVANGTVLGDGTIRNAHIQSGMNTNIVVTATWSPAKDGPHSRGVGRDLVSQYLSGFNTSITVKPHLNTIPGQPILCKALSHFNATFAVPRLRLPGDSPGESSHFIRDATFHFLSSTATFTLVSPLKYDTIYLDFVNATALYNHTEPIGRILYDLPFAAPPGISQTPRLPVVWSLDSVGYDAVRKAVGGKLQLDARATVDARLGNWKESFWYHGKGIGASVHLT